MKVGPGTVIAGRFVLRSVAAAGGMGSVFLANDLDTSRNVAIKILSREGAEDLVRFGREASLLATVHHPNIVSYIAHGESDGAYYIAQEWVEGSTLAAQLRTVGVTASEAIALATGVAEALGAAHAIGVVHRDVKPSNIILDGNSLEQPRLVDFGVARMTDEAGVLTRTGVLVGTPAYMSPEQCRATTQIDAAADVWALGCVLYEALTGRTPFAGATATATRAKVLLGTPPPLKQFCAEASDPLAALVGEMLTKDPARRPVNGTAVTERLRALPVTHDGPRRKTVRTSSTQVAAGAQAGQAADLTKTPRIGPQPGAGQVNSYVFVTPQSSAPSALDDAQKLAMIADRMGMQLLVLEDGTAVLTRMTPAKPARSRRPKSRSRFASRYGKTPRSPCSAARTTTMGPRHSMRRDDARAITDGVDVRRRRRRRHAGDPRRRRDRRAGLGRDSDRARGVRSGDPDDQASHVASASSYARQRSHAVAPRPSPPDSESAVLRASRLHAM